MQNCFLFFLLLCLCPVVSADVMGIDFGSDYIKIAGLRKGRTVDIFLNEEANRKTPNFIVFIDGERYIGSSAQNLAFRFPFNTLYMVNRLIGVQHNSSEYLSLKNFEYEFELHHEKRNMLGFSFGQDESFTVEEIYAMVLQYCRHLSETNDMTNLKGTVLTIPFRSSMLQRQTILRAARLVDMNILGLLHSTTSVALYYGVRRQGFGDKTVNLLVYDIGSTYTEVGVYKFSPPDNSNDKKVKDSESFGTITTLTVVTDPLLGGRAFDLCLSKMIEDDVVAKLNISKFIGGKTMAERKSQFLLFSVAKKAREVLSVNTETRVNLEGIVPNKVFSTLIYRKDMETRCSSLYERAQKVAEEAIAQSGLALKDIDAFEMMGGVSRTPKIIADLSAMLGREVGKTINSDESAALGAGYYALRLSSYRVRFFKLEERVPFNISFRINPPLNNFSGSKRLLAEKPLLGLRQSITLNRTEDFSIELFDSEDWVGSMAVTGVKDALEKLGFFAPVVQHPNNSHIVRVEFRLNESGLFEVQEASVIYRYAVNVSLKQEPNYALNESNESDKTAHVVKMRHRSLPLLTTVTFAGPLPLLEEEFKTSRNKIKDLAEKERKLKEAYVARNNLESYFYWAKQDGILENQTLLDQLTAEKIETLKAKLLDVEEWLETGPCSQKTCFKEEYESELDKLKEFLRNETEKPSEIKASEGVDDSIAGDL